MITYRLRLLLLLASLIGACGPKVTSSDPTAGAGNDALYQKWMESHEERAGEVETYRNPTFSFPVARGREGFTIARLGEFTWHRIAPQDGNMDVPARWRFADGSTSVIIVSDPATGLDTDRLTLISLQPTVMKLTSERL